MKAMKTFKEWFEDEDTELDHMDDCPHKGRDIPLNVTPCACYEESIWNAALDAVYESLTVNVTTDWRNGTQ